MNYYNQMHMGGYGPRPYPMPMPNPTMSSYPGMMRPSYGPYSPQPYPPSRLYGMHSSMQHPMASSYHHQFSSPYMPSPSSQYYQQQNPYAPPHYPPQQPYPGASHYPPMHHQQQPSHRPPRYSHSHSAGGGGGGGSSGAYPQPGHYPGPSNPNQRPQSHMMQNEPDLNALPDVPGDIPLQYPQTFRLEEHLISLGRGSYTVKDMNGDHRYKIESRMSLEKEKIILDSNDQVLLKLHEARLQLRDRITVYDPADMPILTLQKTQAFQMMSKRVNGYLGDNTGGPPVIIITGNRSSTHFRICDDQSREIATISRRKWSMKNMMTDQDTYDIKVNFGSPALICFLTVAIDKIFED